MKLRWKNPKTGEYVDCRGWQFNVHALFEVIVYFEDDSDTIPGSELEVELHGEWIALGQAFRDKLLITDNYNTCFFEPASEAERERGYR